MVFLVGQIIGPFAFALVFAGTWAFDFAKEFKATDLSAGTAWSGRIWYPQQDAGETDDVWSLNAVDASGDRPPEILGQVKGRRLGLVPGEDRLWLITDSGVGWLREGKLEEPSGPGPGSGATSAFEHQGRPAVFLCAGPTLTLLTHEEGIWRRGLSIDLSEEKIKEVDPREVRMRSDGARIHLFIRHEDEVSYGLISGSNMGPTFEIVGEFAHRWVPILADGQPVVIGFEQATGVNDQRVVGRRPSFGSWLPFLSEPAAGEIDLGAYPLGDGGRIALATRSLAGPIRLRVFKGGKLENDRETGEGRNLARFTMTMLSLPYLATLVLSLLLAFLLTVQMPRYRHTVHVAGEVRMPYGSLWRRALAQLIDGLLSLLPCASGCVWLVAPYINPLRPAGPKPEEILAPLGLLLGGTLWACLLLVVVSYLEGRWGVSPGKALLRLRVYDTDLLPCGFGRALIRNLLKIVDGFFNFTVGLLLAAMSQNWQRLGDMAAGTVVVSRSAEAHPHELSTDPTHPQGHFSQEQPPR